MTPGSLAGVVLAAGEGRRLGRPKALVTDSSGQNWLARSVAALRDGGVVDVVVVVGASRELVRPAVPGGCRLVEAVDWQEGMGASLRAGLGALLAEQAEPSEQAEQSEQAEHPEQARSAGPDAVVVMLVDTPGVGAMVVRRLAASATPGILARASYGAEPGHPVLIGRDHWPGVVRLATGDRGARDYLREHDVTLVECADIGSGTDIDTPDLLETWRSGPLD